jgi:hypothetical protein
MLAYFLNVSEIESYCAEKGDNMEMDRDLYLHSLKEIESTAAFNMGLKAAVNILEASEMLSPEGRRFLLKELKKRIA